MEDVEGERGKTAIHLTTQGRHVACLRTLLKWDQDKCNSTWKSVVTREGLSPVHIAASDGHLEGLRCLFDFALDINTRDDAAGETPLYHALRAGRHEAMRLLLSFGADPLVASSQGWEWKDGLEARDWTPLHYAAYQGDDLGVEILLEAGANTWRRLRSSESTGRAYPSYKRVDTLGNTAIHCAALRGDPEGSCVRRILNMDSEALRRQNKVRKIFLS